MSRIGIRKLSAEQYPNEVRLRDFSRHFILDIMSRISIVFLLNKFV